MARQIAVIIKYLCNKKITKFDDVKGRKLLIRGLSLVYHGEYHPKIEIN